MSALKYIAVTLLFVLGLAIVYGLSPMRPVRDMFTVTTIDAPKDQVWKILTDFGSYRQWNPFYTQIEGRCAPGARINVEIHLEDRSWRYSTELKRVTPDVELAWNEQLFLPGLFDGEHSFAIESTDSGQTRFVQHDLYSGALAPLIMSLYQAQAESGLRKMNDALKLRAEQASSSELHGLPQL